MEAMEPMLPTVAVAEAVGRAAPSLATPGAAVGAMAILAVAVAAQE
jgi:hypothetical protein